MIIDKEWRDQTAEKCAEALTMYLLDVTNPQNDDENLCGCLNCLSKIAIDVFLDELEDQQELQKIKSVHNNNISKNNVN